MLTVVASAIAASTELDEILEDVRQDYDVDHISNVEFNKIDSEDVIVFDVRQKKEYKVSHLKGAIQLDPDTSADDFFKQHADKLKGKVAVFYCSVGQRSSRMLSKLKNRLPEVGVDQAFNLEGGAFKWSNDNIEFVRNGEATKDVHPYNAYWGRLVNNKDAIKYKAE